MPEPRPLPRPLSDDDAVSMLATALRGATNGRVAREADLFPATVSAECLYDRLAQAGMILSAPAE